MKRDNDKYTCPVCGGKTSIPGIKEHDSGDYSVKHGENQKNIIYCNYCYTVFDNRNNKIVRYGANKKDLYDFMLYPILDFTKQV